MRKKNARMIRHSRFRRNIYTTPLVWSQWHHRHWQAWTEMTAADSYTRAILMRFKTFTELTCDIEWEYGLHLLDLWRISLTQRLAISQCYPRDGSKCQSEECKQRVAPFECQQVLARKIGRLLLTILGQVLGKELALPKEETPPPAIAELYWRPQLTLRTMGKHRSNTTG